MIKKLILLAAACAFLFGCSDDDDNSNANCPKPGEIEVTELNSAAVKFTWGIGDQTAWQYEYGLAGFGLGTGTVVGTSETEAFIDGCRLEWVQVQDHHVDGSDIPALEVREMRRIVAVMQDGSVNLRV